MRHSVHSVTPVYLSGLTLDLETLFLVWRYSFIISRSHLYIGHRVKVKVTEHKICACVLFMVVCLWLPNNLVYCHNAN